MYHVILSKSAQRVYENLDKVQLKKIHKGLCLIEQSPLYYSGKIIPLTSPLKGKYRCKEGKWRIIYTIDEQQKEVNVEVICARKNAPY